MVYCALCAVPAWSQLTVKGIIKDKETHPVIGASVIIRSLQDTLNYKGCITDENGQFIIEKIESGKYGIEISFIGYTDYRQEFELDQSLDFGEIVLAENTMLLDEVVVTASMAKRFADKKEYKLTNIEKEQYSSALSALEHLPKIQVVDQTVNSMDGKAVKILINGIPSTPTDLSVISSENISKLDYYTQLPIQYSNMSLGTVINVITKEKHNGGSVGINTQNAVTTGFGNNAVNFKYNWGNSQLGVTYSINYRNYNKRILDEDMSYAVGGTTYQKQKNGKKSPYAYEQQMAEISFNNSKSDNYIFSTKLSFNSLNRRRSSAQDIISTVNDRVFEKSGKVPIKTNISALYWICISAKHLMPSMS